MKVLTLVFNHGMLDFKGIIGGPYLLFLFNELLNFFLRLFLEFSFGNPTTFKYRLLIILNFSEDF